MAGYSSFSFVTVKKQFGLKSVKGIIFDNLQPLLSGTPGTKRS